MIPFIDSRIAWCFHKLTENKTQTVDPMLMWRYVYQNRDNQDLIKELENKTKDILTQPDKVCADVNSFLQEQNIDKEMPSDMRFRRFVFWEIVMNPTLKTVAIAEIMQLADFLDGHFDLANTEIFDGVIKESDISKPSSFFHGCIYPTGTSDKRWKTNQDVAYLLQKCYLNHIKRTPTQIFLELYIKSIQHHDWYFKPELVLIYNIYYDNPHSVNNDRISIIEEVIEQIIIRDNLFEKKLIINQNLLKELQIAYLANILQESQSITKNQAKFNISDWSNHFGDYKKLMYSSGNTNHYPPQIRVTQAQKDFMCKHYSQGENQTEFVQSIFGTETDKCANISDISLYTSQEDAPVVAIPELHTRTRTLTGISDVPLPEIHKHTKLLTFAFSCIGLAILALIIYCLKTLIFTATTDSPSFVNSNNITPRL